MEESPPKSVLKNFFDEFSFIQGNFLIILSGWLLIDFTREMANTYYPLYLTELGGTATILGLIGAVATMTEAMVKIQGGYLADKYRRKRLITVMTLIASASYLFYALAPSWHYLLIGAIISSFCWIYTPGFDSIVIESLPENKRGSGYSLINLITQSSTTPSPLIAGFLFIKLGVIGTSRVAFSLVSIAFLAASLMRWRMTEDTDKPEVNVKAVLNSVGSVKTVVEGVWIWRDLPQKLTTLLTVETLFIIPNMIFNTILILFLVNDLGVTEVQLSILITLVGMTMISIAVPCGRIIDKLGRVKPLLFGYALSAASIPILLIKPSFTLIFLVAPVVGVANIIFNSAGQALWADIIPADKRGRVMGSKSFFNLIAMAGGNILGGFLYDNVGHTAPIYIYIVGSLLCFSLTLLFVKDPDRFKKEEI
jgi:MFS family permease